MKQFTIIFIAVFFFTSIQTFAQTADYFKNVPMQQLLQIVKAEDELRYDKTLEDLMRNKNPFVRKRAALAAGRIGDADAIPMLSRLLDSDLEDVQQMAAFAIGEVESIEGAKAILNALNYHNGLKTNARAVEAAGKIAAAKPESEEAKKLGKAILSTLDSTITQNFPKLNNENRELQNQLIILGLTATLRAKPEGAENTLAKFLTYSDWRIRADALNTLARLRAKNVNEKASELLSKDENPIVRANAARVLGTANYEAALDLILDKALNDNDLRVRINSIRVLSSFKNEKISEKLLTRAEGLFTDYKRSKYKNPSEENELLTIASTLGTTLKGSNNQRAVKFLDEFRKLKKHTSPEIEIALVRISPKVFAETKLPEDIDWKGTSGFTAGLSEAVDLEESNEDAENLRKIAKVVLGTFIKNANLSNTEVDKSFPDVLNAYAKFKTDDLSKILLDSLKFDDVIIRTTAANLLGEIKPENPEQAKEIYRALSNALSKARTDKLNDASLGILDALKKQYENRPRPQTEKFPYFTPFISAIESPDYLIRRKAAEIYKGFDIPKPDPMTAGSMDFKPYEIPKDFGVIKFLPDAKDGAKSRVVRVDYKRALSRKNGEVKAVLKTDKGEFTINFFPEEAPLTVDNFINLANSGYFDGLEIHRVVPNFVVQDGDPRGDGSGGPGWQIRDEINQLRYERGMVGMALSGKDTGGSQWFVTHSPQPHLDGGYTIFGKVNETDMKVVDNLVRGDKILSVKIFEKGLNK